MDEDGVWGGYRARRQAGQVFDNAAMGVAWTATTVGN